MRARPTRWCPAGAGERRRPRTRRARRMLKSPTQENPRPALNQSPARRIPSARPAHAPELPATRSAQPRRKTASSCRTLAIFCGRSVSTRPKRPSSSWSTRARTAGPPWWGWPRSHSEARLPGGCQSGARRRTRGGRAEARVVLGDAYFRLEKFSEARKAYEEALKLDADNRTARQNLDSDPAPGQLDDRSRHECVSTPLRQVPAVAPAGQGGTWAKSTWPAWARSAASKSSA